MLDAADDAGVDSLLPVLVVLVAELPAKEKDWDRSSCGLTSQALYQ